MVVSDLPHSSVMTRLGVSSIHGVGVFAITAIPAGTRLFVHDQAEIQWIEAEAIDRAGLNEADRALYRDFAIRRDGRLGCPASFDLLTSGWFLNEPLESQAANVRADQHYCLSAKVDIRAGEELTLDYADFNSGPAWN